MPKNEWLRREEFLIIPSTLSEGIYMLMKNFWDYIIYKQKKKSLKSALSTCWHVCRPNPLKMKDREKN